MTPVQEMLSRSVNDSTRVIRMMIISDASTWSVTYDHHSDNSRGVIYDGNILIIQASGVNFINILYV